MAVTRFPAIIAFVLTARTIDRSDHAQHLAEQQAYAIGDESRSETSFLALLEAAPDAIVVITRVEKSSW